MSGSVATCPRIDSCSAISLLRASTNVKKCGLTACHIFGLLYKLEPYADFAAVQPLLATRVPVLDGSVVVYGEIVLGRLVLQGTGDRRPCPLGHDRKFVPSVVQQQGDHRFGHLRVRGLGPHKGVHFRGLVIRAFLQQASPYARHHSRWSSSRCREMCPVPYTADLIFNDSYSANNPKFIQDKYE